MQKFIYGLFFALIALSSWQEVSAQQSLVYSITPSISGGSDFFAQDASPLAGLATFTFFKDSPIQSTLDVNLGASKYPALFVPECIPLGLFGIATYRELKVGTFRIGFKFECPSFTGGLEEKLVITTSGRRKAFSLTVVPVP